MKKNTLILLAGAVLGFFAFRYFLKAKKIPAAIISTNGTANVPTTAQPLISKTVITAYTGQARDLGGYTLVSGDKVEGIKNNDGSLIITRVLGFSAFPSGVLTLKASEIQG